MSRFESIKGRWDKTEDLWWRAVDTAGVLDIFHLLCIGDQRPSPLPQAKYSGQVKDGDFKSGAASHRIVLERGTCLELVVPCQIVSDIDHPQFKL